MSTLDNVLNRLSPYNLTEVRRGQWRCNTPFRPGADSMSFTLIAHDGEHGAYFDHVSGERGSLYQLALQLGIERAHNAAPIPVANSKRKYNDLIDFAQEKGISLDGFEVVVWYENTLPRSR